MSTDRQPRHRRASLLKRLTAPAPDTAAKNLAPVPHEPPPTMLLPKVTVVPVGAARPGSIIARTTGLNGVHATAVLPALRSADHDQTQVIRRENPLAARDRHYAAMRAAGEKLLTELRVRHDVLLNAFDEQHAAEAGAWTTVAARFCAVADLEPLSEKAIGGWFDGVDRKIDVWVNGDQGLVRFNRDRVNAHWVKVVGEVQDAHAVLELQAQGAENDAKLLLAHWRKLCAGPVAAPTDTIPELTPAALSAMDAVKAAEDRVHLAQAEAGESR